MKNKKEQLDEWASMAMQAILTGIHSHPAVLAQMGDIAMENKQSLVLEVAERAYTMAQAMYEKQQKMNPNQEFRKKE